MTVSLKEAFLEIRLRYRYFFSNFLIAENSYYKEQPGTAVSLLSLLLSLVN